MPHISRLSNPACIGVWVLALACTPALAQPAPAAATGIEAQRAAFLRAYASAQLGGEAWRAQATGLANYPLYPYLEATALEHSIHTATTAEVEAYLERYPGLIPAEDLRSNYLRELASRNDWSDFLALYRPGLGDTLSCDALRAHLADGAQLDFQRDLAELWREPSLPGACTPVLVWAQRQGLLTRARLLARIQNAAAAGSAGTIAMLASWLPPADAIYAERLVLALRDPAAAAQSAVQWPDDARNRRAAGIAITRLARYDSEAAVSAWPQLREHFQFDAGARNRILAALALYRAIDFGDDALQRLAALPVDAQTDDTREWRVRVAIAQQDWLAALAALDALSAEQKQSDEWRYFRARVLEKLGHKQEAETQFALLAGSTGYFNFLAADRVAVPYAICPLAPNGDPAREDALLKQPGLSRAFELFAVGMFHDARREWDRALDGADAETQYLAADLASRRGWYSRPIFVFSHGPALHRYLQRFPLAYEANVLGEASDTDLDPAWVYAIIRAESAWMPDVGSPAGAQGLMQLMYGTAQLVSRTDGVPFNDDLYDPGVNIALGTHYLADMSVRYNDAAWLATAAYNAGPGRVDRWLAARGDLASDFFVATIPYHETREYVARVMEYSVIYDWRLHGNAIALSRRMPRNGTFEAPPSATTPRKAVVCPASLPAKTAAAPNQSR
ncbi:MAG: transglycosylase SLT domain-containing protein [Gammaproteobacteria bacterium]